MQWVSHLNSRCDHCHDSFQDRSGLTSRSESTDRVGTLAPRRTCTRSCALPDSTEAYGTVITRPKASPAQSRSAGRAVPCAGKGLMPTRAAARATRRWLISRGRWGWLVFIAGQLYLSRGRWGSGAEGIHMALGGLVFALIIVGWAVWYRVRWARRAQAAPDRPDGRRHANRALCDQEPH